jgi:hypothetical protein
MTSFTQAAGRRGSERGAAQVSTVIFALPSPLAGPGFDGAGHYDLATLAGIRSTIQALSRSSATPRR